MNKKGEKVIIKRISPKEMLEEKKAALMIINALFPEKRARKERKKTEEVHLRLRYDQEG